jgi:hypothetical protein
VTNVIERAVNWKRLVTGLACAFVLASCGSGAVSDPSTVPVPGPLTVTPASATLYSDLPTTFVVSGGNGSYIATSSDQNVLPVAQAFTSNTLTVVPNQVGADTNVTLTIRDTSSTAPVSASLTVKPRTVSNVVTITPSSTTCGTAICAGGDAEVSVVLTQGALPLAGRQVRFDVISGDFRIITGTFGSSETVATSLTTTTDAAGVARVRVRALSNATSQIGLIDITDLSSGLTRHSSLTISPLANGALSAQPTQLRFVGRSNTTATTCATGISADVIVSGGRPPYTISAVPNFTVSPTTLARSGDHFTVTAIGLCSTEATNIAVVDSLGASVTVTAVNQAATAQTFPPLVVAPTTVTLTGCTETATISVGGGRGEGFYVASSGSSSIQVVPGPNYVTIRRAVTPINEPAPASPVRVAISDGLSVEEVTVNLTQSAAQLCR